MNLQVVNVQRFKHTTLQIVLVGWLWAWKQIGLRNARLKQSEVAQSCPTLCDPIDCSLPGSSVHGIFQAIVLEWVAISFSRGSSRPRARTRVSHTVNRRFTVWATREVLFEFISRGLTALEPCTDFSAILLASLQSFKMASQLSVTFSSRSHIHRQTEQRVFFFFFSSSSLCSPVFLWGRKSFPEAPQWTSSGVLLARIESYSCSWHSHCQRPVGFLRLDRCPCNRERPPAQNTVPYGIQAKSGFSELKGFWLGPPTGSVVVVQLLGGVQCLWPHGPQPTRFLCPPLSPTVCSNSYSLSQWCYLTIWASAAPFSFCRQSSPTSESFPVNRLFASGGQLELQHQYFQWIFNVDFL